LGWDDIDLVLGPAVTGLSYIGLCKLVDDRFEVEVDALWHAMFPNIDRDLPDGTTQENLWSPQFKRWRNAWCDVHTVWTHINSGRDIFVTLNTSDFQRHAKQLGPHGLKRVMTPQEAVQQVLS